MFFESICALFAIVFLGYLTIKYLQTIKLDLKGESVFITGCDSGFGYHLARRLACKGLRVFAGCYSKTSDGAIQLSEEFTSSSLVVLEVDVTRTDSVERAVSTIENEVGDRGLWALVNNAGIAISGELELCSVDDFEQVFQVNVLGPVRCTQKCLPLLRITKGRIINMCSVASSIPSPCLSAYSASKAALLFVNDCLTQELKRFGILTIRLRPYFFKTNIVNSKCLVDRFLKSWSKLPKIVQDQYGENFLSEYVKTFSTGEKFSSSDITPVIDTMEIAIVSKYPKRDYLLGGLIPKFLLAITKLPACIIEPIAPLLIESQSLKTAFQADPSARKSAYLY